MGAARTLSELVVVDRGTGMAAAIVARQLSLFGMKVYRSDAVDPFDDVYPAHRFWRGDAYRVSEEELAALEAGADICIVGGEHHPDIVRANAVDPQGEGNSGLIVLDLGSDAGPERRQIDLFAQARSGICFEQFSDRPFVWIYRPATYGLIFQGLTGLLVALLDRLDTGLGQVVRASLDHGICLTTMPDRVSVERPDDQSRARIPRDVRSLIFRCADGHYIQFTMQRPGALARVYRALGIEQAVDPLAAGHKQFLAPPRNFFGDHDLFAPYIARFTRDEVLSAFWANGVAADAVLEPGECWDDAQTRITGTIVGDANGYEGVGAPFRVLARAQVSVAPPVADRPLPLAGLRVVGLGTFIAGPYAAKIFADLGADVVKIDSPAGDPNTNVFAAWAVCNPGKRSIVIDMKQPEGTELVHRLCATADLVHVNFRAGVGERLGLDPVALRTRRADQILLRTTAYGLDGPKAENPGLDPILQGAVGLETLAGGEGNDPLWYRTAIVDYATGSLGAIALLVALFRRRSAGEVCDADVSLLDGALFLSSETIRGPDGVTTGFVSNNAQMTGAGPDERLYAAQDGWIALRIIGQAMADRLGTLIGRALPPLRDWDEAVADLIAAEMAQRSCEALLRDLAQADVWAERVREIGADTFSTDPLSRTLGIIGGFDHPHYGAVNCVGAMFRLSRSTVRAPQRPPAMGEQGREIASELGYGPDAIERMYASGALR